MICERLIEGESLRQICSDKTMPGRRTISQWLAKHPEFAHLYAEARSEQAYHLANEAVEIADTEPDIARARLMIDARFAWISKLAPRRCW